MAHETEKTVREVRSETAAAVTSGEARNGTRDREDGSRRAHRDCGSNHERKPGMAHETEKTVREMRREKRACATPAGDR